MAETGFLEWVVTMSHDKGEINISTVAADADTARKLVCWNERAPLSAAVAVRRWVAIDWSQDLIVPDGSDSSPDGDPVDEPGTGSNRTGGWLNLRNPWKVDEDFCAEAHRIEYDAEDASECTPVEWLAKYLDRHLEGLPERAFNVDSPTIYASGYSHPYENIERIPAAHPHGFLADEIREAIQLVRGRY